MMLVRLPLLNTRCSSTKSPGPLPAPMLREPLASSPECSEQGESQLPFQQILRGLLACAVFAHAGFLLAGPIPETCNAAQDNASLQFLQVPASLQPGVP